MPSVEAFLSANEEQQIIDAIKHAERKTSGEIRVHIEQNCTGDSFKHAVAVFHKLKMHNTAQRNAVLIYVAIDNKSFVIYGDKGIHQRVADNFWDTTKNAMAYHFKQHQFAKGLIEGITTIGIVLSEFFPWEVTDANELDNSISKG